MSLTPNQLLYEYRIERLLGQGAFGVVYLAHDTFLDRPVAIKELTLTAQTDEVAFQRFLQEARAAGNLNHPHIVTVYAVGEHAGRPYLALEYLEGQTLRQRIREERLGWREAIRIGLAVCEALREAHANDVLHRDLKPGNVLIPKDGRIRVVDFGISKVTTKELPASSPESSMASPVGPEDSTTRLELRATERQAVADTARGDVVGTPIYLAPERWLAMDKRVPNR